MTVTIDKIKQEAEAYVQKSCEEREKQQAAMNCAMDEEREALQKMNGSIDDEKAFSVAKKHYDLCVVRRKIAEKLYNDALGKQKDNEAFAVSIYKQTFEAKKNELSDSLLEIYKHFLAIQKIAEDFNLFVNKGYLLVKYTQENIAPIHIPAGKRMGQPGYKSERLLLQSMRNDMAPAWARIKGSDLYQWARNAAKEMGEDVPDEKPEKNRWL